MTWIATLHYQVGISGAMTLSYWKLVSIDGTVVIIY